MQHIASEDYAHQCDPVQPKTRAPRPKDVHKPYPAKIFETPKPTPKPAAKKPHTRKSRTRKPRKLP